MSLGIRSNRVLLYNATVIINKPCTSVCEKILPMLVSRVGYSTLKTYLSKLPVVWVLRSFTKLY